MDGLRRNSLGKLNALLEIFPAVLVLGVRQCGKTTLSKQARPDWKYFDLENAGDHDFLTRDLEFFFSEYSEKLIIDEAQEYPELFKHLRSVIDQKRGLKNRFILTGSSSPELIQHASESLAGRLGVIELGTFKMNEAIKASLPHFYQMFNDELTKKSLDFIRGLKPEKPKNDPINHFLKGGYPEPFLSNSDKFSKNWMQNYFQLYINRDIKKLFPKLDSVKYRRFISTLSELSGTVINKAQLGRSLDISEVTTRDYLEIADKTFIWRMIPSYEKSISKTLIKMPKGYIRDSGLTHFLSSIDSREKLLRSPNVGHNFEAFVSEEIIKGVQCSEATNWSYYYYRTKHGAEVDLILDGSFGVLPIEIKFGTSTQLKQLSSLKKFVLDNQLPFGIVINNSYEVRMLTDQIIQIPVSYI